MDGEREPDKRRRLAVGMAPLRTLIAPSEELPIANEPSSGRPGRVFMRHAALFPELEHLSADRPDQVGRLSPQVERRGEDLAFDQ